MTAPRTRGQAALAATSAARTDAATTTPRTTDDAATTDQSADEMFSADEFNTTPDPALLHLVQEQAALLKALRLEMDLLRAGISPMPPVVSTPPPKDESTDTATANIATVTTTPDTAATDTDTATATLHPRYEFPKWDRTTANASTFWAQCLRCRAEWPPASDASLVLRFERAAAVPHDRWMTGFLNKRPDISFADLGAAFVRHFERANRPSQGSVVIGAVRLTQDHDGFLRALDRIAAAVQEYNMADDTAAAMFTLWLQPYTQVALAVAATPTLEELDEDRFPLMLQQARDTHLIVAASRSQIQPYRGNRGRGNRGGPRAPDTMRQSTQPPGRTDGRYAGRSQGSNPFRSSSERQTSAPDRSARVNALDVTPPAPEVDLLST